STTHDRLSGRLLATEVIPPLRFQGHNSPLFGNHYVLILFFMHIPDEMDVGVQLNLFIVGRRNGEQRLVVFPAVERTDDRVEFEFEGSVKRQSVDRYLIFKDTYADARVVAQVEQL